MKLVCVIFFLFSIVFLNGAKVQAQEVQPLKKEENTNTVKVVIEAKNIDSPGYHVLKGIATYQGKDFPIAFEIFLQKEYFTSKEKFPAIVALHNIWNDIRGSDGNPIMHEEAFGRLMSTDIAPDSRQTSEMPAIKFNPCKDAQFIGIIPQCAKDCRYEQMPMSGVVVEIINWVEKNYRVDSNRCYLTGYSYGGMCTWAIGMAFPERFAAIVPLSCRLPSAPETVAEKLKNVGVWCGVGELDGEFFGDCNKMNGLLVEAKHPNFHFIVIKGGNHFSFPSIYSSPDLWKWLFAQKRQPKTMEIKK